MKTTIEVDDANFDTEVLKSAQPVLLDVWAPWCGPCRMIAPVVEEIAAETAGRFKIVKVNVDENPAVASRFNVRSIPTLLYFAKGEARDRTVGLTSKQTILSKLENLAAAA